MNGNINIKILVFSMLTLGSTAFLPRVDWVRPNAVPSPSRNIPKPLQPRPVTTQTMVMGFGGGGFIDFEDVPVDWKKLEQKFGRSFVSEVNKRLGDIMDDMLEQDKVKEEASLTNLYANVLVQNTDDIIGSALTSTFGPPRGPAMVQKQIKESLAVVSEEKISYAVSKKLTKVVKDKLLKKGIFIELHQSFLYKNFVVLKVSALGFDKGKFAAETGKFEDKQVLREIMNTLSDATLDGVVLKKVIRTEKEQAGFFFDFLQSMTAQKRNPLRKPKVSRNIEVAASEGGNIEIESPDSVKEARRKEEDRGGNAGGG